jgi:hypothetical protein
MIKHLLSLPGLVALICAPAFAVSPIMGGGGGGGAVDSVNGQTGTVVLPLSSTLYPESFGAVGDGTTDDTAAIQAAINAAQSSGKALEFAAKTYKTTATLNITSAFIFRGQGMATIIQSTFATGDVIHVEPTAPPSSTGLTDIGGVRNMVFRDFKMASTVTRTSGYAIGTLYTTNMLLQNIEIGDFDLDPTHTLPFFGGVSLLVQGAFHMNQCRIYSRATGVAISGSNTYNFFRFDGIIDGQSKIWSNSASTTSVGVLIGGSTGGVVVADSDICEWGEGIRVDTSLSGETNREFFMNGAFLDNNVVNGLVVTADSLTLLECNDMWAAGNGRTNNAGTGVSLAGPTRATISGGRIYANETYGLTVDSGVQLLMTGVNLYGHGSYGIYLLSGSVATLAGNDLTGNTGACVHMASGVLAVTLSGNNLQTGNPIVTGDIPTYFKASGNLGYADADVHP